MASLPYPAISLKYALAAWVCSRKMHKHEGDVGVQQKDAQA